MSVDQGNHMEIFKKIIFTPKNHFFLKISCDSRNQKRRTRNKTRHQKKRTWNQKMRTRNKPRHQKPRTRNKFPSPGFLVSRFVLSPPFLVPSPHFLVPRFVPSPHFLVPRFVPSPPFLVPTITRNFEKNDFSGWKWFFLKISIRFACSTDMPLSYTESFPEVTGSL